jgi:hypothetical protein
MLGKIVCGLAGTLALGMIACGGSGDADVDSGSGAMTASTPPAAAQPNSLCLKTEKVEFACNTTNKKNISICSSNGAVQYRFGSLAQTPEIALPKAFNPGAQNGVAQDGRMMFAGAGAGGGWASFQNGTTTYVIYDINSSKGLDFEGQGLGLENQSGVMVVQNGKFAAAIACADETPQGGLPADPIPDGDSAPTDITAHVPPLAPAIPATGSYSMHTDAHGGTLEIKAANANSVTFSLGVGNNFGGFNQGELPDTQATPDGRSWVFSSQDMDCRMELKVNGTSIALEQRGMCEFGANVDATGTYLKK